LEGHPFFDTVWSGTAGGGVVRGFLEILGGGCNWVGWSAEALMGNGRLECCWRDYRIIGTVQYYIMGHSMVEVFWSFLPLKAGAWSLVVWSMVNRVCWGLCLRYGTAFTPTVQCWLGFPIISVIHRAKYDGATRASTVFIWHQESVVWWSTRLADSR